MKAQNLSIKSEVLLVMEWESPTRPLTNVLRSIGEYEWGKGGVVIREDDDWNYPPVVVWRYKYQDEKRDQLIKEAVESFKGKVEWTISFRDRETLGGRNWSISPKPYKTFQSELKNNPDLIKATGEKWPTGAFAILHPEIGLAANQELPQLAEHIKSTVEGALSTSEK